MLASSRTSVLAALACLGCSRMQPVAHGPIDVGATPVEVRFVAPAVVDGPRRELCFEFEHARDSHLAAGIAVTLVTPAGRKEALTGALDRHGEALVSRVGSRAPEGERAAFTALEYRGAELSSPVPVRLRGLRWKSGE